MSTPREKIVGILLLTACSLPLLTLALVDTTTMETTTSIPTTRTTQGLPDSTTEPVTTTPYDTTTDTTTSTTTTTTTTTTGTTAPPCLGFIEAINVTCPITPFVSYTYPDPDHCSRYWECYHGCATNLQCQLDYLYDTTNSWCNYPQLVVCYDRPCDGRPCAPNPPSTPAPPTFQCPTANGYFADPTNCIKYYQCTNYVANRITCPKGAGNVQQHYSPNDRWCDYPDRVQCGERPVCDEYDQNCQQMTTSAPTYCDRIDCANSDVLIPQGPCSRCFCECPAGYPFAEEICCQSGLAFNPETLLCDYPSNNPGCGMR